MKNLSKIITVVIIISICLLLYLTRANGPEHDIINITGNNGDWSVSLNMHVGYNNDLLIMPSTDEFEFPSEINIDILAKDKSIYTDKLKITKNNTYNCKFASNRYLERNYKDISVVVSFNDETSKVQLTLISYP